MSNKETSSPATCGQTQSNFTINIPTNKRVSQVISVASTQGTAISTTIKDVSPATMPDAINTLIHALQASFNAHHPRILDIYNIIQDLNTLSSKLEAIESTNKSLGEQLKDCVCENELENVKERMRSSVKEKKVVDAEMTRLRGVWGEAMRWVEDEDVMHDLNIL